ncbi:hypothetical protein D3C84_903540 [compost metagenome]
MAHQLQSPDQWRSRRVPWRRRGGHAPELLRTAFQQPEHRSRQLDQPDQQGWNPVGPGPSPGRRPDRHRLQYPSQLPAHRQGRQRQLQQCLQSLSRPAALHFFPGGQSAADCHRGAVGRRSVRFVATHGVGGQPGDHCPVCVPVVADLAALPRTAPAPPCRTGTGATGRHRRADRPGQSPDAGPDVAP